MDRQQVLMLTEMELFLCLKRLITLCPTMLMSVERMIMGSIHNFRQYRLRWVKIYRLKVFHHS